MLSTIENKIQDETFKSSLTTPDSIEINRLMNDMVKMTLNTVLWKQVHMQLIKLGFQVLMFM